MGRGRVGVCKTEAGRVSRRSRDHRALQKPSWRFPGAKTGSDFGRNADDCDRQVAQGRTAPGVQRLFCEEERVVVANTLTPSSFRGASEASEPGIHNHDWGLWIPGLSPQVGNCRPKAHPGMTKRDIWTINGRH